MDATTTHEINEQPPVEYTPYVIVKAPFAYNEVKM